MMSKYDDLLERAKWEPETVSPEEIRTVAELLPVAPEEDHYILLYILGSAGDPSYRSVVEPYLAGPDDHMARLAVWILCRWWDLTAEYKDHLLRFLRGVEWDDLGQASRAAAGVAGEYLREHTDPDLLEALLDVYRSGGGEVRRSVRQSAFYALVDAVGDDLREYPHLFEDIELDPPPDPTVITRALKRLLAERIAQLKDGS